MAASYLFFRPARLPLEPNDLSAETVLPLEDFAAVRAALDRVVAGIRWTGTEGQAEVEGKWLEFHLEPTVGTLGLRCSLRADYREIVQRLCDELGWLAFDGRFRCHQPHRPPMPA